MRAVCWFGPQDVRVERVPDPAILNPRDAIVRVTATAICGSDLHLYNGHVPTMRPGDILGHEFMGEVVAVGPAVRTLRPGERVVVPFPIACGHCFFCRHELWALCDNSNPNAWLAERLYGFAPSGIFGYSHLMGGYAGGQAEYVRVPFADVGPLVVPPDVPDERLLFLTDVFPTGYMAVEQCGVGPGDTVAVWGCGPVGQFAVQSAWLLGASRVIALDRHPERLALAARVGRAEVLDYTQVDVVERLRVLTGGRGPDVCVDAVGMESHGLSFDAAYDAAMQTARLVTDRAHVLRQVILACRKGGTVSIPGVYGGVVDKVPMGAAFNKGLVVRMGQTHVHRYVRPLLQRILRGEIDPAAIVTHRLPLEEAPRAYRLFRNKEDGCLKVVMRPAG